ncbi:MAG TPA: hypothetical protein VJA66_04580 [Thermoanaerobaculia bacterium]
MTVGNTWTPDEEKSDAFHGFVEIRAAGGAPAFTPTSALIPPFKILWTTIRGVSQAGAVGLTVDSGTNLQYPFLLDRNGFRRLELPGVSPPTGSDPQYAAFGINDVGVIVGIFPKKVNAAVTTSGFALAAGLARLIDFPDAGSSHPPVTSTLIKDINNWGEIVGRFDDQNGTHGFRGDYYGGFFEAIDFVDPATGAAATLTVVNGVNDSGDIVGHYLDAAGALHSFLRRAGKEFQTVDLPPPIFGFQLNGIDATGQKGIGTGFDDQDDPYAFEVDLP